MNHVSQIQRWCADNPVVFYGNLNGDEWKVFSLVSNVIFGADPPIEQQPHQLGYYNLITIHELFEVFLATTKFRNDLIA